MRSSISRGAAAFAGVAALAVSASAFAGDNHHRHKRPNFIVILADDLGKDAFALNNPETADPDFPLNAPVPSLGSLAEHGVLFKNGWAMPVCSTTRGTRSYGLLPSTTGMGGVIGQFTPRIGAAGPYENAEFPPAMVNPNDENLVQKLMRNAGYRTIKLGKWHEVSGDGDVAVQDVLDSGFEAFYGFAPGLLAQGYGGSANPNGDFYTLLTSNELSAGVYATVQSSEFLPSFLVSRAIEFLDDEPHQPFYMALDFGVPHFLPPNLGSYEVAPGPNELMPADYSGEPGDWRTLDPVDHASVIEQVETAFGGAYPPAGTGAPGDVAKRRAAFKSLISYMDVQIGRLMEHVDLNDTYVIFLGDNGTQGGGGFGGVFDVVEAPNDALRSKGSLYRNGVEVPYIIAGPKIRRPGRASDALITSTDVLATVTDLAGLKQPKETRRQSFSAKSALLGRKGLRKYNVAEAFAPTPSVGGTGAPGADDGRVVADKRFRLIAKPVLVVDPGPSPAPNDDVVAFVCDDDYAGDADPLLEAECFNALTGVYEKKHQLEFYDTRMDPFENDALVFDEMNRRQGNAFIRLCVQLNRISRKAVFHQNGKVCQLNGGNLIDIDPELDAIALAE